MRRQYIGGERMFLLPRLIWIAVLIMSAIPALAGCADGDRAQDTAVHAEPSAARGASGVEQTVNDIKQRFGDKLVRVIATVKASPGDAIATEQAKLVAAMKQAGALVADPIPGQPLVVIECKAGQLEAAVRSGLIVNLQLDALDTSQ